MTVICLTGTPALQTSILEIMTAKIANSPSQALALSRSGPCLLLVEEAVLREPAEAFFRRAKAANPACHTVLLTAAGGLYDLLPHIWQRSLDGVHMLRPGPERGEDGGRGATMLADILSMEYVHDLIYGHLERLEEIRPLYDLAGIDLAPTIVLTLVIDNFWQVCAPLHNRARYQLKRQLLECARQALAGTRGIAATLIGTDKVVVLLECPGEQGEAEDYAVAFAQGLMDRAAREVGYSVSVGVSCHCPQPDHLWRAYEQSFRALQGAFHKGHGQVLLYAHQAPMRQGAEAVSGGARDALVRAVSRGDGDNCRQVADELVDRLAEEQYDEYSIKSALMVLVSEVSQYTMQIGLDASETSSGVVELAAGIVRAASIGEIRQLIGGYLAGLADSVARQTDAQGAMGVAKAYMERYYAREITLKEMAALCGYSPSHFSRSFKEAFGVNFVQYLTGVRLDRARQLLDGRECSLDEVAEQTGFRSTSYFSYVFKRETGLSPGQYRAERAGDRDRDGPE